jgi:hypothetical protein
MGAILEMMILNPTTTYLDSTSSTSTDYRKDMPDTLLGFLRSLNGLTVIDIEGKDKSRWRVVTTLIHGNEPSGIIACHAWLKKIETPATNIRIIICNPEAAKTKPFFTNRYLKHSDDLNRFFSMPPENQRRVTKRARKIMSLVRQVSPEAIVDLHNTSGNSPAFAVSISDEANHLKLIELFTDKLILTQLGVGAIMEQSFNCPIVTIECGGANQQYSHQIAEKGLALFFNEKELFEQQKAQVTVSKNPIRIELIEDASVGFSDHYLTTTDITLREDVESLNKDLTKKGEVIGWCQSNSLLPIKAINSEGIDLINDFFKVVKGEVIAQKQLQLFMATTVPEIATNDCLFYTTI